MTDSHYAEPAPHTATSGADGVRPLPSGHRLAGFELDSVLGTGGFGIVYRAFDRTLQRTVAVKEYMPAMLASRAGDFTVALRAPRFSQAFDAGRAAFLNEARLLAQFDHPGLVKVLHFWESHGTAYMVMPFYEGQTLEQIQKRGKRMSEAALLRMLASVLGALDVLHRAQCFHRDISLDNILILPNGNPVLLDFGAARKLIGDMVDETTMMLKPGYAPIEQYTDDPAFRQGPWTDIYALGAVAHVLTTGELPQAAVVRSIRDQYRPLAGCERRSGEHYGERVRAAIDHALALRIEDRPESVAAFAQELGLHEPAPGVFVPAGYEAPARGAGAGASERGAGGAAAAAKDEHASEARLPQRGPSDTAGAKTPSVATPAAQAPAAATGAREGLAVARAMIDRERVEAPKAEVRANESAPARQLERSGDTAQAQAVAQPGDESAAHGGALPDRTESKSLQLRFAWRPLRIPALILLLILAVGIPALRYAIRAPSSAPQATADRSAPAIHTPALAQALPGANTPAQAAAGGADTSTQAQQQPGASGLTPPAPAMTTDTAVVEVQAGKDKPANATDLAAASPQPAQTAQEPQAQQTAQAAPAAPPVAQAPSRPPPPLVRTPAPMPPVRVHFQVLPWGEVYVDGVRRGVSPPFHMASLSPGTHRIEIRNGSLTPYVRTVTLDPGSPPLEISYKFE